MKLRLAALAMMTLAMTQSAGAQQNAVPIIDGPTYLMTYAEVIPSAESPALNALKDYRDAARKEPGVIRIDLYQEQGQSHRFVLEEIWQNRAVAKEHANRP